MCPILIQGYDSWLLAQADEYMRRGEPVCDCCGQKISDDGVCYACEQFDRFDDE